MSSLPYFDYEGFGERSKQNLNYSQAVRLPNTIHISGQGGWDRLSDAFPTSLDAEIDQAFANVEHALQQAGGTGLQQVYKLRIFITGDINQYFEGLTRHLKGKGFEFHGPLLTVVQVKGLFRDMRIEIEAEAWIGL
ncbi:hypothetical protein HBH64_103820 [Parastagonospora nodorum]|nr:hypothetical protein HBI10_122810 [Parastagonospora nodorum]KAH4024867.1 hypothetical protein HBI13_074390 [Parastagonospora nodorum]KAH4284830.1 hypothetical protein HBI02_239990 [Parastagonospora nodorum]KAH4300198.1 hypothetical protein HBI01_114920 [Parastagonospora nodorum]KAH4320609.1 hypothetical protein HBI00_224870 [Parastagonospora nodorum]